MLTAVIGIQTIVYPIRRRATRHFNGNFPWVPGLRTNHSLTPTDETHKGDYLRRPTRIVRHSGFGLFQEVRRDRSQAEKGGPRDGQARGPGYGQIIV